MQPTRRLLAMLAIPLVAVGLTACGSSDAPVQTTSSPAPEPSATATSTLPTVAGYDVGDFPPIPLFQIPDLSLLDASLGGFALELKELVGDYPGLTISTATCDASGEVQANQGALRAYGDGSGSYTGADGSSYNYGDGSGTYSLNGVEVSVYGDGSGRYEDGTTTIANYGDGSGVYEDGTITVNIYGDGSGRYESTHETIANHGDGSGAYTSDDEQIANHGDGSGSYEASGLSIFNYGDGTGTVNGTQVEVDPLPTVPLLGVFPPMGVLAPLESCGTVISIADGVLFDFGRHELRSEAKDTLDSLARALADSGAPSAEIGGHTDSISSEEFNQQLSERRAQSVVDALVDRGVTSSLNAVGYGKSKPVAPNEIDGKDNPAGRQLNRRVEIFVPAF